jgi:hypothetical protein
MSPAYCLLVTAVGTIFVSNDMPSGVNFTHNALQ